MKVTISILLLILSSPLLAQNCNCEDEFNFVVNYYEENLPGFDDNVNKANRKDYNQFKEELKKKAKKYCDNQDLCIKTLLVYVEFFKDNHSSIYATNSLNVDESKAKAVKKFISSASFQNRERITNAEVNANNSLDEIENKYQSADGVYTVVIVESQNEFRDYAAVIVDSKTPLWEKGQVKFDLKKVGANRYDMFLYMRNHSLKYYKNVSVENGVLNENWFNLNLETRTAYNLIDHRNLTFKVLDKETNYLYLPTFRGDWYAKLSEFYQKNDSAIQSKPYLIIDVRNNGGGSDACVSPLLKYIYTHPFLDDKVEVFATKENIRKSIEWYEMMKADTANYSQEFLTYFSDEIERMKAAPNRTFVLRGEADTVKLDQVLKYPEKVAIISNKYCASSCETLLFWAMESDKTIIVGENSGGYVGYGEISSTPTPNFGFELGCTMTRYDKQRKYEVDGIPPDHYLNKDTNWIEQTVKLLKQENSP